MRETRSSGSVGGEGATSSPTRRGISCRTRATREIDLAIEEAAKRGRTNTALAAMEGQRRARAGLVDERNREAGTLWASLKAERATVAAKGRQIEREAAPIRYVAELLGGDTGSKSVIRWLIALLVLCSDPLAIALTAAALSPTVTTFPRRVC
jgi:hypothetical protein